MAAKDLDQEAQPWQVVFEAALTERSPKLRPQRIAEAETAIAERIRLLRYEPGNHKTERRALQHAARILQNLRRTTPDLKTGT
jgi:geranylgeranyl pyrophosphate synthase